jgi:hypothetical protein
MISSSTTVLGAIHAISFYRTILGASPEADYVTAVAARNHQYQSHTLGSAKTESFERLYTIFEDRQKANWDGYGAEPMSLDSYRVAYRFLEALPPDINPPTIGAEPDGQITIEWYVRPSYTISISASPEGELHYAAMSGPNRVCGTEAFFQDIPANILRIIRALANL